MKFINHNGQVLAIIIPHDYTSEGINFITPDDYGQQLAYMNRPQGYKIEPHVHNMISREVKLTQEVLLIRKGKIRVDFYDDEKNYLSSIIMVSGDVILLASGGHGFEMLEPTEIIEVKQGPYCGELDKVRFSSVENSQLNIQHDIGK